jgi:hypothetical protein
MHPLNTVDGVTPCCRYVPSGQLDVCGGTPLQQWVKEGHDNGTTLHGLPNDAVLVQMGRELLGIAN